MIQLAAARLQLRQILIEVRDTYLSSYKNLNKQKCFFCTKHLNIRYAIMIFTMKYHTCVNFFALQTIKY